MKNIVFIWAVALILALNSCTAPRSTMSGVSSYPEATKDIRGTWAEILLSPHKITTELPDAKATGKGPPAMVTWYYFLGQKSEKGSISWFLLVSQDADKFKAFSEKKPNEKIIVTAAEIDPLTKTAIGLIEKAPEPLRTKIREMNLYHVYLIFGSNIVPLEATTPAGTYTVPKVSVSEQPQSQPKSNALSKDDLKR